MASATVALPARPVPLLNKYAAAEQLGVHPETLILWARKKRIRSTRSGAQYRFKQEYIDEFIAANETAPLAETALPKRNPKYPSN